ncbi:hypothetical protein GCM10023350_13020 [Nocardioides endophyticus]|uniref:DUF4177 domain-containing protein n=1 Tax=Nocardioides endophyticus TaxID=1353775 RepID=A0ABP8YKH3_9ACTN
MGYVVIEHKYPEQDYEDMMNMHLSKGYRLVQVVQGFTTADGDKTVYWKPRYVFFKED